MAKQAFLLINTLLDYIETHLDQKIDLKTILQTFHYSKYYVHHLFSEVTGMTIHEYVQRRQLTEASKRLVFSDKRIIDIALVCGYQSQQAFTSVFKAMYKLPPAEFREQRNFYPLQLRFILKPDKPTIFFTKDDIRLADESDLPAWMNLIRLVIDGYPVLNEESYLHEIEKHITEMQALVLKDRNRLIGAMAFSTHSGSIDFFGIHPQYRNHGIHKLFLEALVSILLPGKEISMTTYHEEDKADTGHRETLKKLGFAERELLIEFGYPTQRFVLSPNSKEDVQL